ncbi:putative Relaxase/mobilization nuclease family protein [Thiomonas sp. CB3]|nr:putative Relaxase/mobilization nuclease family protein [Thiomonas sp. CB3]
MIPHVIKLSKSGSTKGVFVEPIQYAARDDLDSKAKGLAPIPEEDMGCVNIDFDLDTEEQRLWLGQAMTATSSRSVRFQGNPVYHVSISWPEGEHPTREECEKTVHHIMKGVGMEENEAFWAMHRDTDNDHLHMIVNKVHPERGIVTGPPRFDYALLHRLAREVELDQGWSHDAGAYVVTEPNPGEPQIMRRDIAVKMELWKEEEIRRPNVSSHAHAAAQRLGADPFQVWIAGQPAKDLREAIHQPGTTWESAHQAMAKHGLRIEPKGTGMVVTSTLADGQVVAAKASQLGRWASKAALEKKLGPYRPPSALAEQAAHSYQEHVESAKTRSEHRHAEEPATDAKRAARREERARAREDLAKRFEAEQKRWKESRTQMRSDMRERHLGERKQLQADLRDERKSALAKDKADGVPFKVSQSLFAYRAALRREELQKRHAVERRAQAVEVRRSLDWHAWLEKQAEQGDEAAKAAVRGLRYREQRKSKKYQEQDGIEGEELDPLRKLTVAALHAEIDHKRQLVIYRGQDGREKFTDTGPRLVMQDKADDTLEAALRMAAQKFGGKVDITGNSEFRERATRQAVRLGIKVANADLQAIVADEQARMHGERAPRRATKESWGPDQTQERRRSEPRSSEKTSDLSPELVDKPTPQSPRPPSRRHSAESPEKQATAPAPISPKRAMEYAMEQWLDGDRSSGPVKAFIAAHDRATRQGADGRKLIADVVDRVITRRGEGVDQAVGGFIAEIGRQRNREQGVGR